MPTRPDRTDLLVDTSVAVALVVVDHDHHQTTMAAVGQRRLGLAGHAAFETYSVLTRLPGPARRTPDAIGRILQSNFPATRLLSPPAAADLLQRLPLSAVSGGSVYDLLVAAVAAEHGLTLATRDRRALPTYRVLDVDVKLLT